MLSHAFFSGLLSLLLLGGWAFVFNLVNELGQFGMGRLKRFVHNGHDIANLKGSMNVSFHGAMFKFIFTQGSSMVPMVIRCKAVNNLT